MSATRLRHLLTALAAAVVLALAGGPAAAQDTNKAVAVNTRDGASVFRFAFSVRRVTGEVVDQTNAAVAYSSCEECQTVALAIQVVLVMTESPDVITPTNLAIAINQDCLSCATAALAYQYVLGSGQRVRFTDEGNRRIAAIRREFRRLRREDLTLAEIVARTEELTAELRKILATELVPVGDRSGPGGRGDEERAAGAEGDDGAARRGEAPAGEDPGRTPAEPPAEEPPPGGGLPPPEGGATDPAPDGSTAPVP